MVRKNLIILSFLFCGFAGPANAQTKFELEGNMLKLPKPVTFETGTDKINIEESKEDLNHVKEYLTIKKFITVPRIEVHTQPAGGRPNFKF